MTAGDTKGALATLVRRPVFKVLMIGLIIRIVLMPVFTFVDDVRYWAMAMQYLQAGVGLYEISHYWYTQVWGYVLSIWSGLLNMLGMVDYGRLVDAALPVEGFEMGHTAVVTSPMFNFMVKIPLLISDVLVGYLIYRMISDRTKDEKKATLGFALWFLCPLVICISAVHGMFDTISVLFMVLSVYALYRGHNFLAGASFAVAVLTKMFPGYLIFALIAFIAMKHKGDRRTFLKRLGITALGAGIMTMIIFLPQFLDGTYMGALKFLTGRVDTAMSVFEASGDFWSNVRSIGYRLVLWVQPLIFGLAALFAYMMYRKGDGNDNESFFLCLMLTAAIMFPYTTVPQYVLVIFPFLIFFIVMFDRRFILPYVVITVSAVILDLSIPNFSLLLSLAEYTSLLDVGTVVSLAGWMDSPLIPGMSKQAFVVAVSSAVQLIGILMILLCWRRYGKEGREYV